MSHSQFEAIIPKMQMGTERSIFPQFGKELKNTHNMFGSTMRGKANKNAAYKKFEFSVTKRSGDSKKLFVGRNMKDETQKSEKYKKMKALQIPQYSIRNINIHTANLN